MERTSPAHDPVLQKWTDTIEKHRAAIAGYVQSASRMDDRTWRLPVDSGKWTPAQITDHLLRTYRIALDQVRGGPGIKPQYGFLLRQILRLAFLPRIFRTRRLPAGAKAPVEIRPSDSNIPRETALRQLTDVSAEFETELLSRRNEKDLRLTHHVFGAVKPLRGVDFVAIHTEHHTRQLPRS